MSCGYSSKAVYVHSFRKVCVHECVLPTLNDLERLIAFILILIYLQLYFTPPVSQLCCLSPSLSLSPHLSFLLSLPLLFPARHLVQNQWDVRRRFEYLNYGKHAFSSHSCPRRTRTKLLFKKLMHVFAPVLKGLPWERTVQLARRTLCLPAAPSTPSPPSLHPAPAIESTGRAPTWGSLRTTTTR